MGTIGFRKASFIPGTAVLAAALLVGGAPAGTAAPPGRVMPSASDMQAMVLAVPITLQVPTLATSWLFTAAISCSSISSARNLPQ